MRVSGTETQSGTEMPRETVRNPQSQRESFQPYTFHCFTGAVPFSDYGWPQPQKPKSEKNVCLSEPEATGYSSTDEQPSGATGRKMPPFARRWFELSKERKEQLRELRQNWSEQSEGEDTGLNTGMDGAERKMPKFAAKWFALSEEEKQKHRATMRKETPVKPRCGGTAPPFAAKWFALPEEKKKEIRAIKRRLNMERKMAASQSQGESDQSDPEIDYKQEGIPPFAAKWFSLPEARKQEIRKKFRDNAKCRRHANMNPHHMMWMAHAYGPAHDVPMFSHTMPWMDTYSMGPHAAPPFAYQPFVPPSYWMMKRFHRAQKAMQRQQQREASETRDSEKQVTDTESSGEEVTEMPSFVKKWFALPMEVRKQLRVHKNNQKNGDLSRAGGIPPFAKKWFTLPEQTKQQMRKLNRQQNSECKRKQKENGQQNESLNTNEGESVQSTPFVATTESEMPEFARVWFALPAEQKHHLRLLNRHLSTKSGSETSEDEYTETMPEFAVQWFALSPKERQQLRALNPNSKPKKNQKSGSKKDWKPYRKFNGHPWQPWAFYSMPPMWQFTGKKPGFYKAYPEAHHGHEHMD